jgi:L-ribulose-5-phosphate 4-epimerase
MTAGSDAVSKLRTEVCNANKELASRGLARFTFGNASAIDRDAGLVVIKPSGVPYDTMTPAHMVVVDMNGEIVEGDLRPSSDLATHLELYRAFEKIGGVVHTHSRYATLWAQSHREIPCFGTTHADYFHGPVPVTAHLKAQDIQTDYEANTGREIVRRFEEIDPLRIPAVLVAGHASFCWGVTVSAAVEIADLLEEVAFMAYGTIALNAEAAPIPVELLDKHFLRKHGPAAYYGQRKG